MTFPYNYILHLNGVISQELYIFYKNKARTYFSPKPTHNNRL